MSGSAEQSKRRRLSSPPNDQSQLQPADFVEVVETYHGTHSSGSLIQSRYNFKIKRQLPPGQQGLYVFELILQYAFNSIVSRLPPESRAQIFFENDGLHKSYISTPRKPPGELRLEDLMERLTAAIHSDDSVSLEDTTIIVSTLVHPTTQAGPLHSSSQSFVGVCFPQSLWSRTEPNLQLWAQRKRCLDNPTANRIPKTYKYMCVPLCIAKGLYLMENPGISISKAKDYGRSPHCINRAVQIVKCAGLQPLYGPFLLEQLPSFERAIPNDVGLNFFDDCGYPLIRTGPLGPKAINIFLMRNPQEEGAPVTYHAYRITSLPSFMGCEKYCCFCFKSYSRKCHHRCSASPCTLCKSIQCLNRATRYNQLTPIHCELCLFSFRTQECFQSHLEQKLCEKRAKCPLCAWSGHPDEMPKHPCGRPLCSLCKTRHIPFARCYVRGKKPQGPPKPPLSIFYADTECQIDAVTRQHHANLVILQHTNSQGQVVSFEYKGPTAMADFTADCIKKGSQYSDSYIVFHNAAGYDGHLWYKELLKAKTPPKSIILKQQKLISMELRQNGIKLRDSLQFLPGVPLASLPKMFDLQSGPKGDFPHLLNTPKWIQWGQKIVYSEEVDGVQHRFPLLSYFMTESKRPEQLEALTRWHGEMVAKYQADPTLSYIPEEELTKYCRMDTKILRLAFDKYRQTWLDQYPGLEPLENITFPSFNNRIFREVYMPKDSLCLLPPPGYNHKNRPYSKPAMAWLAWKQRQLELTEFRTARHGYEVKINAHYVDGTGVDPDGKIHVLDFFGCWYHGCPCREERTPLLDARLQRTRDMNAKMRALGMNPESPYGYFTVHTIWECEFKHARTQNPELDTFVVDYYLKFPKEPLRPRAALRGGRTESIAHRVQVDVQAGFRLYYMDFTSLYPAVNFSIGGQEWPIGHPDIYIGKDLETAPSIRHWLGFASVRILPPKHLKHPVLGQLINDRFLFHLCSKCAAECRQDFCDHRNEDRVIQGTFFTGELQMALSKGYKLLSVMELWNWPPSRRSTELFRGLIRDQYSRKALSSAVPSDPAEFQRLLTEYKDTMGLELHPEQFKENKALRALCKFSINNIWGYLGKRNDVTNMEFTMSEERAFELSNDPERETEILLCEQDERYLILTYKDKDELPGRNGNICIAAMTTAYARLELYRVLDKYSDQTIYMDTDSLFLLLPPGMEPPPSSNVLGGLKDEIQDEFGAGAYISSFFSTAPKSYTFRVERDGVVLKDVMKHKGISLTTQATEVINPTSLQQLVGVMQANDKDREELEYLLLRTCIVPFPTENPILMLWTFSGLFFLPYEFLQNLKLKKSYPQFLKTRICETAIKWTETPESRRQTYSMAAFKLLPLYSSQHATPQVDTYFTGVPQPDEPMDAADVCVLPLVYRQARAVCGIHRDMKSCVSACFRHMVPRVEESIITQVYLLVIYCGDKILVVDTASKSAVYAYYEIVNDSLEIERTPMAHTCKPGAAIPRGRLSPGAGALDIKWDTPVFRAWNGQVEMELLKSDWTSTIRASNGDPEFPKSQISWAVQASKAIAASAPDCDPDMHEEWSKFLESGGGEEAEGGGDHYGFVVVYRRVLDKRNMLQYKHDLMLMRQDYLDGTTGYEPTVYYNFAPPKRALEAALCVGFTIPQMCEYGPCQCALYQIPNTHPQEVTVCPHGSDFSPRFVNYDLKVVTDFKSALFWTPNDEIMYIDFEILTVMDTM